MKNRPGFTLTELLVTLAIIAILAIFLLPMAGKMMESARQVKCAANLRQLYSASMAFSNDHDGWIVRGLGEPGFAIWSDALAPYVQMNHKKYGHPGGTRPQGVFACPCSKNKTTGGSRSDFGSNYYVNGEENTATYRMASLQAPSKTIAFIDSGNATTKQAVRSVASWMGPTWGVSFRHGSNNGKGVANAVFFDGHIEQLKEEDFKFSNSNSYQSSPWSPNPL